MHYSVTFFGLVVGGLAWCSPKGYVQGENIFFTVHGAFSADFGVFNSPSQIVAAGFGVKVLGQRQGPHPGHHRRDQSRPEALEVERNTQNEQP